MQESHLVEIRRMESRQKQILQYQVQIEGISKLVDCLNVTMKQKMDVDDFEAKNGDKAT